MLVGTSIATFVVNFASCKPFVANWDASIPATCIDRNAFYIWTSIPNIVTDLAILFLPMRVVWNLHTSRRTKVSFDTRKDPSSTFDVLSPCTITDCDPADTIDNNIRRGKSVSLYQIEYPVPQMNYTKANLGFISATGALLHP